jgi:AraC-like DNA-binding protein
MSHKFALARRKFLTGKRGEYNKKAREFLFCKYHDFVLFVSLFAHLIDKFSMDEQVADAHTWLAPLRKRYKLWATPGMPAGSVVAREVGGLQVLHLSGLTECLRMAPAGPSPWITAIYQRAGSAVLRQDASSLVLRSECLVFPVGATPFEIEFAAGSPGRQTWLVLSEDAFHGVCPAYGQVAQSITQHDGLHVQMIAVIADLLQEVSNPHPHQAGQHVAEAVAHLLAAALTAQERQEEPTRTSLAKFHLARIKQFVLANLNDPELTVRKVSEQLKISPSHIHRVFLTEHETFGEWLWAQRLAACRAALEKSADTRQSISQIAFGHGFSNSSHFSRAFKARFGISPSEARGRKKSRSGL